MNKYRNRKTVYRGIKFDSVAEAEYYDLALWQAEANGWKVKLQERFELMPKFELDEKKYLVFWEERDTDSDLYQWFAKSENNPIETLIRMKNGYEVKKEPLYRVKLGEGYFVEYQGRGALIMIIPDDNKEIKIFDSKSDAERTAQTIGGTVEEVVEG